MTHKECPDPKVYKNEKFGHPKIMWGQIQILR